MLYFTIGLALFFSMSGIVLSNNNHMDDKGKYYLFGLLLVLAIHYYHKAKQFGIHAFYLDTTDVKCNNQQSCIDFNKSAQQVDAPEPASPAGQWHGVGR